VEIEELLLAKKAMEREIHSAISRELGKFWERTGYCPEAISVELLDITSVDAKSRRYMVNKVASFIDIEGVSV